MLYLPRGKKSSKRPRHFPSNCDRIALCTGTLSGYCGVNLYSLFRAALLLQVNRILRYSKCDDDYEQDREAGSRAYRGARSLSSLSKLISRSIKRSPRRFLIVTCARSLIFNGGAREDVKTRYKTRTRNGNDQTADVLRQGQGLESAKLFDQQLSYLNDFYLHLVLYFISCISSEPNVFDIQYYRKRVMFALDGNFPSDIALVPPVLHGAIDRIGK